MSDVRRPLVGLLLALCVGPVFAARGIAPPTLDDETTQTHHNGHDMSTVIWFPARSFEEPDQAPDSDENQFAAMLKGYAIFGVASGKDDGVTPDDAKALRASVRLTIGDKPPLVPMNESDLPPKVRAAIDAMGPAATAALGPYGSSVQFVVFKDPGGQKAPRVDPLGRGDFRLGLGGDVFTWHLPLVSLQPLRVDPVTGDSFPGNYDFSPFTGRKLVPAK